jgi:hypothetical protein
MPMVHHIADVEYVFRLDNNSFTKFVNLRVLYDDKKSYVEENLAEFIESLSESRKKCIELIVDDG